MRTIKKNLICRKAKLADIKIYYRWANDPEVRKNSLNTKIISWATHKSWFQKKLKNKNSVLYIFKKNNNTLGQVRFDKAKQNVKISYSIDRKFRRKGYGSKILIQAIKKYKSKFKITLVAIVKFKNIGSIKIFQSLKFRKISRNKVYKFTKIYSSKKK